MDIEEMQNKILQVYRNELKHEEKYDEQFNKLMDKYEDILYGKIARICKGKDITNKELYGPDNMLLSFSNAFKTVLNDFYKELNFSGKLYQATQAINIDLSKELDITISAKKDDIEKQVNKKNSIDNLTLSQRLAKSKVEFYNKLMKTVTIDVAKKKSQFQISESIAEDIRSLLYIHGRLMGTEMNRILNENLVDIYKKLGIKNVEFSAVLDSKTSYICTEHHGRIYPIDELITGITQPPLHPNCRSILLPHE